MSFHTLKQHILVAWTLVPLEEEQGLSSAFPTKTLLNSGGSSPSILATLATPCSPVDAQHLGGLSLGDPLHHSRHDLISITPGGPHPAELSLFEASVASAILLPDSSPGKIVRKGQQPGVEGLCGVPDTRFESQSSHRPPVPPWKVL